MHQSHTAYQPLAQDQQGSRNKANPTTTLIISETYFTAIFIIFFKLVVVLTTLYPNVTSLKCHKAIDHKKYDMGMLQSHTADQPKVP